MAWQKPRALWHVGLAVARPRRASSRRPAGAHHTGGRTSRPLPHSTTADRVCPRYTVQSTHYTVTTVSKSCCARRPSLSFKFFILSCPRTAACRVLALRTLRWRTRALVRSVGGLHVVYGICLGIDAVCTLSTDDARSARPQTQQQLQLYYGSSPEPAVGPCSQSALSSLSRAGLWLRLGALRGVAWLCAAASQGGASQGGRQHGAKARTASATSVARATRSTQARSGWSTATESSM